MKITPESMKKQYEDLWNIFCKKNHDYGNSFERSLDKHGLVAGVVRMEDKMNRLYTLTQGDKDAQIASESLVDTLMDLSNYAAMAACWLDGPDDVYNEEYAKNFANEYFIRQHTNPEDSSMHNIHYGVTHHSDGGLTVFYKNGEDDSDDEYKLSNFEGHQEKVNEREYFNGVLSDHTIIKNWALVGDSKTVRSRTTGQYLTEDDNPELFRKIYGVLKAQDFTAAWKPAPEDIVNTTQPLLTDTKGLENGYFIRQHTNPEDSSRYTLAFNPEGTVKTQLGEELPYVIECSGNDYDGMTLWAIHVFNTREDMVAALNYDLKKHLTGVESKNFGDTIGELNITKYVFSPEDTTPVSAAWINAFGQAFDNNMTSRNIFSDSHFGVEQGIKTFRMVFISEKTGALVVTGLIREIHSDRNHNFVWFSDTKEVLLEVMNAAPKFNSHGIFYDIDSEHLKTGENICFNPLYNNMEDKILSKFHTWDGSELKNLVFFNEDKPLNSEFMEKRMQIPGDLSEKKLGNTDGNEDFDRSFGHI